MTCNRNGNGGSGAWRVLGVAFMFWAGTALGVEATRTGRITEGLSAPTSVSVSTDGIAVLETGLRQLVVYSADGVAVQKVDVDARSRGLARLQAGSYLYCDPTQGRVARVDLTGRVAAFLTGLQDPVDVLVQGTQCFVLDAGRRQVRVTDPDGTVIRVVDLEIPAGEAAGWLSDLARDRDRDLFYAWNQTGSRALVFDNEGNHLRSFSSFGSDEGAVTRGGEIVCDHEGWIYITDRYQGQVVVFRPDGAFALNVDPLELGGQRMIIPAGLAVDDAGFLYVAATEGPSIDLFHLDKSDGPLDVPTAVLVRPAPGDLVPARGLSLVAGLQAPALLASGLTAEFRIFAATDTLTVVAEATGIQPGDLAPAGDLVVGTATWEVASGLTVGGTYLWQARAVSGAYEGTWSFLRDFSLQDLPPVFLLEQNVPNPFNPRTVIAFTLTGGAPARLDIHDIRGQLVWSQSLTQLGAGPRQIVWNGVDDDGVAAPSGVYFYRLTEGRQVRNRKMVLVR